MSRVLYNSHLVTEAELREHQELVQEIVSRGIHSSQVRKLEGVKYPVGEGKSQEEADVFRAKINKKARIIYTYIQNEGQKTLYILSVHKEHNYNKLKRQLSGLDRYIELYQAEDELEPLEEKKAPNEVILDNSPLSWVPVVSYNNMHLKLDEGQNKALERQGPLVMSGPPGSGKTAVLYTAMLHSLKHQARANAKAPWVLFVSPSTPLLNTLQKSYEAVGETPVEFTTWSNLLQGQYKHLKPVAAQAFAAWSKQSISADMTQIVHYEMSLLAALGAEQYAKLGRRQSHFGNNQEKQALVQTLLTHWRAYLGQNQLFDPMVTLLPASKEKAIIHCDEAQNLPPVALRSLIDLASGNDFVACLDNQQCLLTSPYIRGCLDALLYKRYGGHQKHRLERTWRCPPEVAKVANQVMGAQVARDDNNNRREYARIESTQAKGGLVSWVDDQNLGKLKPYAASANTMVIVAHEPSAEERRLINEQLGTNNILTAAQAIGLDFSVVVLWRPLSQSPLKKLSKKAAAGLSLEEWYAFNALYVALTRAQSAVFVCEPRQTQLGLELLGPLESNQFTQAVEQRSEAEQRLAWEALVEHHLAEHKWDAARQLMSYHLHLTDAVIEARINARNAPMPAGEQQQQLQGAAAVNAAVQPKAVKKELALPVGEIAPQAAAGARPSNIKSKDKQEFIKNLSNNLTEDNINKLFALKNAATLLFKCPLENGTTLFQRLIVDPNWWDWVLGKTEEHLDSLAPYLTTEFLGRLYPDNTNANVLFWICAVPRGLDLFASLLRRNPQLVNELNSSILCQLINRNAGNLCNTSPLYFLSRTDIGLGILQLLENNKELIKGIKIDALCFPRPKEAGAFTNRSALLELTRSEEGLKWLGHILRENLPLAKKISARILCLAQPQEAGKDANKSPLYCLASFIQGRELLKNLLELNPDLAKGITAAALCLPLTQKAGQYANMSPLCWLAGNNEGRALLKHLLQANPDLAKGITSASLCLPRTKEAGLYANMSPLGWLAITDEGIAIIKVLIEANPELAKGITGADLCLARPKEAQEYTNLSPLFTLTRLPEGRTLLKTLLEINPGLAKGITGAALCLPRTQEAGESANESPLYWLANCEQGIKLLKILLELNPDLTKEITGAALCLPLPKEAGGYANIFPLGLMVESPEGRAVLITLLEKNPALAKEINPEILTRRYETEGGSKISALDCLKESAEGERILKLLQHEAPQQQAQIAGAQQLAGIGFFATENTPPAQLPECKDNQPR